MDQSISRAPKPPTPVKGGSWRPQPELSECPVDLPTNYPSELKIKTWDAINRAIKAHPAKREAAALCRKVIADLSPALCELVSANGLRADLAPDVVKDLLRSLLLFNVSTESERHKIGQALMRSDEWAQVITRLNESATARSGSEKAALISKYREIVVQLNAQIEELTLSLQRWKSPSMPGYRSTIKRKTSLENERDRLTARVSELEAESKPKLRADAKAKEPMRSKRQLPPLILADTKVRASYSQHEAARLLGVGPRQIRTLVAKHKINQSSKGRIVNDEKLKAEYGGRHEPIKR